MGNDEMNLIKKTRAAWEKKIAEAGTKERKTEFLTRSRIPVKRVYTPLDLKETGFDYVKSLNFPGEYPFTRGIDPLMYRENLWLIGQYGGFGSAEETNQRFKYLLSQGIIPLHLV